MCELPLYIYIYIYTISLFHHTLTHTHTHTHTYIYPYIYPYPHTYKYIYVHLLTYTYIYKYIYIHIHKYIHKYIYIPISHLEVSTLRNTKRKEGFFACVLRTKRGCSLVMVVCVRGVQTNLKIFTHMRIHIYTHIHTHIHTHIITHTNTLLRNARKDSLGHVFPMSCSRLYRSLKLQLRCKFHSCVYVR